MKHFLCYIFSLFMMIFIKCIGSLYALIIYPFVVVAAFVVLLFNKKKCFKILENFRKLMDY